MIEMLRSQPRSSVRTWVAAAVLSAGLALAVGLISAGEVRAAPADPAYSEDFSAALGPEWLTTQLETSPNGERFLGRFTNDTATLKFKHLPKGRDKALKLELGFDIYIIDSMDGNDTGPGSSEEETGVANPDTFRFEANGKLLQQTTFSNTHPQAYPGSYPGASNPAGTAATGFDTLDYDADTTFHLSFPVRYTGRVVNFSATASGLDDLDDESWGIDNVVASCPLNNTKTGRGYSGLAAKMKAALGRLYDALDGMNACYGFSSGYRSQAKQNRLYRDWHKIADKPKGDKRKDKEICNRLHGAGFAQCPKGWKKKNKAGVRVAKGGPARRSRHTSDKAADISVFFSLQPNLSKYRKAARSAGLCGPAADDPVHVELPYKRKDGAHKKKLFKCHFPEGPAPKISP